MSDSTRGLSTDGTVAKATEQPDGERGAVPLEWPTSLQVSGVGSPHTLALLRAFPAGWAALQEQLKWMQDPFCQKTALDKRHLLAHNVM